jgi:hypothetical protein
MHGDIIKGSYEEINHKSEHTKIPLEVIEDNIKYPKSIIFEFETDTIKKIRRGDEITIAGVLVREARLRHKPAGGANSSWLKPSA